MRRLLLSLLHQWPLLVPLALAACGDGAAGLDRLSEGERGRVVSVRSGDTVMLAQGLVVRLAGIEVPHEGEVGAETARADLARLVQGREVQLLYGGARRDSHGRGLAQLRVTEGRGWVQGALLRDGFARVRTFADNRAMAQPMLDDEARARAAKRGLWGSSGFQVRLPGEIDPSTGGFQIVEGRVQRVTTTRWGVYLDFSESRNGFAALVSNHGAADLAAAGLAPTTLAARLVRLRGPIGWNAVMTIDHPEQIEVLRDR